MTLETIYYIGQTVAVGAILASLVAIYIQQRQTNIITKSQNSDLLGSAYADAMNEIMINEDLAQIFRKVMFKDNAELTPVEITRILIYFNLMLTAHRSAWLALESGLYDERIGKDLDANTAWYLTRPLFLSEWKRLRAQDQFGGGFSDHINSLIQKPAKPVLEIAMYEEPNE